MNCWEFLGIEPTNNKRLIKKAYAILLKQYKPDEHPEEFQQLNLAYKECLYWSSEIDEEEQYNHQANQSPVNSTIEENIALEDIHLELSYSEQPESSSAPSEYFEQLDINQYKEASSDIPAEDLAETHENQLDIEHLNKLLANVRGTIVENRFPSPDKLAFLKSDPMLLDWDFNNQLGTDVLALVATSLEKKNRKGHLGSNVSNGTLRFLNEIFAWDSNPYLLYNHLEYEMAVKILDKLEASYETANIAQTVQGGNRVKNIIKESYQAEKFERFFAFVIDGVLIILGIYFIWQLAKLSNHEFIVTAPTFSGIFLISYFLLALFFESNTKFQGTPGKLIFNLKVIDFQMQPLNIKKALIRLLCHYGNILLFVYLYFTLKGTSYFIYILIALYALSFLGFKFLRYDELSKTQVVRTKEFSS